MGVIFNYPFHEYAYFVMNIFGKRSILWKITVFIITVYHFSEYALQAYAE